MSDNGNKQSFVMYNSFLEAAELLGDKEFRECVLKLRDFALYGDNVSSDNPVVEAILRMAKPNIDAAAARYQRCVENGNKGKEHGHEGGRPRKGETKEEYDERKRALKTPRKPLDDDEEIDIKVKKKEDDNQNVKLNNKVIPPSWTPSASSSGSTSKAETCSVSGNTIRLAFYPVGNSSTPGTLYYSNSARDILFNRLRAMNDADIERQYVENISKIAQARAKGTSDPNERDYATEAALIYQYLDKVSLEEAKTLVQQDTTARVHVLQKQLVSATAVVNDDDQDQPF